MPYSAQWAGPAALALSVSGTNQRSELTEFLWDLAWFRGFVSDLNSLKTLPQMAWFIGQTLPFQVRYSSREMTFF
jgi:hypothetical protein